MKIPKYLALKSLIVKSGKKASRSFKGASRSRFTSWLMSSFSPINRDLKSDLQTLIIRSRDLAKNNEIFRSHLHNMQKSIIGNQGFRLQSLIKIKMELWLMISIRKLNLHGGIMVKPQTDLFQNVANLVTLTLMHLF